MGGSQSLSSPLLWTLWKLQNPKAAVPAALSFSCSQLWEVGQLWLHDSGGGHTDRLQMQPPHLLCRADGGYHLPSALSVLPTVPSLFLIPLSPQVSSPEISYLHRDSLSIITYIGCLISALASISTIFFLYFRYGLGALFPLGGTARSTVKEPGWKKVECSFPETIALARFPAGCSKTPAVFNDWGNSAW